MHTESAYNGWTAYCYPEQGMVDRLLRVRVPVCGCHQPCACNHRVIIIYIHAEHSSKSCTPSGTGFVADRRYRRAKP